MKTPIETSIASLRNANERVLDALKQNQSSEHFALLARRLTDALCGSQLALMALYDARALLIEAEQDRVNLQRIESSHDATGSDAR